MKNNSENQCNFFSLTYGVLPIHQKINFKSWKGFHWFIIEEWNDKYLNERKKRRFKTYLDEDDMKKTKCMMHLYKSRNGRTFYFNSLHLIN